MTDNDLKDAVRALWDAVRQDRRKRRKQFSQAELNDSAALLRAHGDALSALAARAPADGDAVAETTPAEKPKRKKAAKRKSTAKTGGSRKTKKS